MPYGVGAAATPQGRRSTDIFTHSQYIVDFVCLEKRLVVELDGGQHTEQVGSDAQRTVWLEARGFRVLRFWNHDVLNNIEAVKEVIRGALSRV